MAGHGEPGTEGQGHKCWATNITGNRERIRGKESEKKMQGCHFVARYTHKHIHLLTRSRTIKKIT